MDLETIGVHTRIYVCSMFVSIDNVSSKLAGELISDNRNNKVEASYVCTNAGGQPLKQGGKQRKVKRTKGHHVASSPCCSRGACKRYGAGLSQLSS